MLGQATVTEESQRTRTPDPRLMPPSSPKTLRKQKVLEAQLPLTMQYMADVKAQRESERQQAVAREEKRKADLLLEDGALALKAEEERRALARQEAQRMAQGSACLHLAVRVEGGPWEPGKPLPHTVCSYCGAIDVEPATLSRPSPEERARLIFEEAQPQQRRELDEWTDRYLPDTPAYRWYTTHKLGKPEYECRRPSKLTLS